VVSPSLDTLDHAIYLLQADVKTEVCCGSLGQVYKGHFSSPLHVLGLYQPAVGLSLLLKLVVGLFVSIPACRGFISASRDCWSLSLTCWSPSLPVAWVSCLLLVCWCRLTHPSQPPCSSQSAALVFMLCEWFVRADLGPLVLVSA
jgi:hypothetical protein